MRMMRYLSKLVLGNSSIGWHTMQLDWEEVKGRAERGVEGEGCGVFMKNR